MNWYQIFYWLVVADSLKNVILTFAIIFTLFAVIAFLWFIIDRNANDATTTGRNGKVTGAERAKKWLWYTLPFLIVLWLCYVLIPDRKGALIIIAGGGALEYFTNDSTAKQIPKELSSFVLTELKTMAAEAKIELGSIGYKEEILNQAKSLTTQELIQKMKQDTTFAKVILNQ